MAHTPNGPAVFYRGDETIYVEDGVQPKGWSDRPKEAKAEDKQKAEETAAEPEAGE